MLRRKLNRSCAYTGLVGSRVRPRRRRVSRRIFWRSLLCVNGPWRGLTIRLDESSGLTTLPLIIRGQTGYYHGGTWHG